MCAVCELYLISNIDRRVIVFRFFTFKVPKKYGGEEAVKVFL